ncbi:fasciclin domain-containing protein [Hydrogenophaga sp.]|uniref:fasciclin domain-containing protein n=1 Tax=Hydrogenophaga sp. TaxID=1904254 RepID=UPI00391B5729
MTIPRRKMLLSTLAGAAALALAGCGGGDDPVVETPATPNLVGLAQSDPRFTTLVSAVVKAGLATALSGTDLLTVFAPTNDAFNAAATALGLADGPALVNALPSTELAKVLLYHVVAGQNLSTGLSTGNVNTLYTYSGSAARLAVDVSAGVKITDELLTTATVTTADLRASNGVIHVIDKVLVPPGVLNVVQIAQLNPNFSTLVGAVVDASLVNALSDPAATLTVFAPTNAAFAAIAGAVAGLSTQDLTTVLTYHVLGTVVESSGIPFGTPVNTLANQSITINDPAAPKISDTTPDVANIVAVDINASNGVIHVIDKVLLPNLPV